MKEYRVNFEGWIVRAKSIEHAEQIAIKHIKELGICPSVRDVVEEIDGLWSGPSVTPSVQGSRKIRKGD